MSNIRSMNRVILVGNIGKSPELTVIAGSGRDVAKFTLATNEGFFDSNKNWKESTEWHNVVAWGPLAKKVERSISKGDLVLVEGRLKTRRWGDRVSGQERSVTEIQCDNVVLLEKRNRDHGSGEGAGSGGGYGHGGGPSSYGQGGGGGYNNNRRAPEPAPAEPSDDHTFTDMGGDDFHREEEDPF